MPLDVDRVATQVIAVRSSTHPPVMLDASPGAGRYAVSGQYSQRRGQVRRRIGRQQQRPRQAFAARSAVAGQPVRDERAHAVTEAHVRLGEQVAERGIEVHVLPASSTIDDVLAVGADQGGPDGVFMSNGPGDPATADHVVGVLRDVLERRIPYFGICYGFQWAAVEYARNVCGLSEADST